MSTTIEKNEYLYKIIDQLKDENAKLHELLRIAVSKYCNSGTCDGCPILGKDDSCWEWR